MKTKHRNYLQLWVLGLLLLAAAARTLNASGWPVWTDEGASIYTASDPNLSAITEKLQENHHPPLYFAALGAWQRLAGESRLALRWLTILGGVVATAVVYRLARDVFGGRAAAAATVLFALSDLAVHYSQQVRHYGWLTLAVALTSLLFLRVMRRPTTTRLLAYALAVAFAMYTHYLALFALALQGAFWLVWRVPLYHRLRVAAAWALAFVLYIPWLIAVQQILTLLDERGLATRPNVAPTTLDAVARFVNLLADGQPALMVGLFALAVWTLWQTRRSDLRVWYLVMLGGGLFVGMIALNTWARILTPRTLSFLTVGVAIVVGAGFDTLPQSVRRTLLTAYIVCALATTALVQPRLATDTVAHALAAQYSPGDLIVLETGSDDNALQYELEQALADPDAPIIRTLPWVGTRGGVEPVVPNISGALAAHDRVWVIQWLQPSQALPHLDNTAASGYRRAWSDELSVGAEYRDLFSDNTFTLALYVRAADDVVAFGDVLGLGGVTARQTARTGELLQVDLWWTALTTPALDYSVSVALLNANGDVVAASDAPPAAQPTTTWTTGDWHWDRHALAIPPDLAPGTYRLAITAYWYGDLVPLAAAGARADGRYSAAQVEVVTGATPS